MKNKKILAIHDMSCFGRCALTVVIPVLSAMGHQVVPLPTALLSTHTGGFEKPYFRDLGGDMAEIARRFAESGLEFDGIYTGFLGSVEQIETVGGIIERFGGSALVTVDPVMGDDGELYSTYTPEMAEGMKSLCKKADVIIPNLTEACFLTGMKYPKRGMGEKEAKKISQTLLDEMGDMFGTEKMVITGIEQGSEILTSSRDGGKTAHMSVPHLKREFPGTGELMASVLTGELMRGTDFFEAVRAAEKFTFDAVELSQNSEEENRNGVLFESMLYRLGCGIGDNGAETKN